MKKDVLINIKGVQNADGESDVSELFTQGNFYKKNGSYYITYKESETTGFEGTVTTLKVENQNKVSLIRFGNPRTNLIIENGVRNVGLYETEHGELYIGVNASTVKVDLDDHGGNLEFKYSLDINTSHISDNEVYINIKEC